MVMRLIECLSQETSMLSRVYIRKSGKLDAHNTKEIFIKFLFVLFDLRDGDEN